MPALPLLEILLVLKMCRRLHICSEIRYISFWTYSDFCHSRVQGGPLRDRGYRPKLLRTGLGVTSMLPQMCPEPLSLQPLERSKPPSNSSSPFRKVADPPLFLRYLEQVSGRCIFGVLLCPCVKTGSEVASRDLAKAECHAVGCNDPGGWLVVRPAAERVSAPHPPPLL